MGSEWSESDAQVRWALRQAALRNRKLRLLAADPDTGLVIPTTARSAQPSPEHYHIVYNVPKENVSVPHFAEIFVTAREGYERMYKMGMQAQPNCEFYEEGLVGIETRLHGRSDLWWVVLELAACIKAQCTSKIEREKLKRQFTFLPEQDDD